MGDEIGSGSVCFSFSLNLQSAAQFVVYGCLMTLDDSLSLNPNRCQHPLITQLRYKKNDFLRLTLESVYVWYVSNPFNFINEAI
jgi:hypothetical protein